MIGIGIIGPFLGVVFGGAENLPKQVGTILSINEYSHTELVVILASLLILIYVIKSFFGALIMKTVIKFSQEQQVQLRSKLITSYQNMVYSKDYPAQ